MAVQAMGICSTCRHCKVCEYRRNNYQPVWVCDEFDCIISTNGRATSMKKNGSYDIVEEELVEYRGLCRNCTKRKTCTFPKSEGGIWHCEEYE